MPKKSLKTKSTPKHKKVSSVKWYDRFLQPVKQKTVTYLKRRPHRSFRKTERRDYSRSLDLPGYWSFTNHVLLTLWSNKRIFVWVVVFYALFTAAFVGMASEDTYTTLNDTLKETGGEIFDGNFGEVGKAALLLFSGVTGSFNATPNEAQQAYGVFFGVMTWLTTVWLLRSLVSGKNPKFRDGLYSSGGAIIPTMLIALVLIAQLIPAAIATLLLSTAMSTGVFEGAIAMIFVVAALLLYLLSLYWTVSTLMAMVIVTLPAMYPMHAIKTAGDLVIGRRLRILYRWLWAGAVIAVAWCVVMIPIILLDVWFKKLVPAAEWLPVVPICLLIMGTLTVLFSAAYVYLLYRKVVEDGAEPA